MATKLFNLVPVEDKIDSYFGHDRSTIECIDGSGNNLFVGTSGGGIVSLSISNKTLENDRTEVRCTEWAKSLLKPGTPLSSIVSASALNRIFALIDGSLHLLTMQDLQPIGGPKVRSVSCFSLNECPSNDDPFTLEMAVGTRKRQIIICEYSNDRLTPLHEFQTDDVPLSLVFDNKCICYATNVYYYILYLNTKSTKPLFPINGEEMVPIVRRIATNEFLLNGLQNLGVFAMSDGASSRPPLLFSVEPIISLTYVFPYVISLSKNFIFIYSVSDQQLKQQVPFAGGRFVVEIEGSVFVVSRNSIFRLDPVSWEIQVESLLKDKLADEALSLAETSRKPGISKEDFQQIFRRLQQKIGFIKFEECKWEEAFHYFAQGKTDVREILSLFPDLQLANSNFVRAAPPLHDIPSVDFVVKQDVSLKTQCKRSLFDFLINARGESWIRPFRKEVDYAILLLKVQLKNENVADFIEAADNEASFEDFEGWCAKNAQFHFQCLTLWRLERRQAAVNLWMKLVNGELHDSNFQGISSLLDFLDSHDGANFVSENALRFLTFDLAKTLKVLSKNDKNHELIITLIRDKPDALISFLEILVFDKVNQDEKVHMQLAETYLEMLKPDMDEQHQFRQRFRRFLYFSNSYRVFCLHGKIEEHFPQFLYEKAILFGKSKEHSKAFDVFVHQMKNYSAAEEYCAELSKNANRPERNSIYSTLLKTYLAAEKADYFVAPVLRLLNNSDLSVDFSEVLALLPSHWSLAVLTPFLLQSSIKHKELLANQRLAQSLCSLRNVRLDYERRCQSNKSYTVKENDLCAFCQKHFSDADCATYPDGELVHKTCVKYQYMSPAGKNVFSPK